MSAQHFGCSTARNKGPRACTNLRTIRRDELEDRVLHALRGRLMDPDLFKVFAEEFVAEWNRLQGNSEAERAAGRAELHRVQQQIERLVDAIAQGTPAAAVGARLKQLEERRLQLEAEASRAPPSAPRLHPGLPGIYRAKVADLVAPLDGDDATDARELVRGLVEHITLHPEADGYRLQVRGELAAIMALAGGAGPAKGAADINDLCEQVKMVAGTGFDRQLTLPAVSC